MSKQVQLSVFSAQGTSITNIADFIALIAWEVFSPVMATAYMKGKKVSTTTYAYLRLPKAG